jgi:calcineurin-like phosphoesterase family protein
MKKWWFTSDEHYSHANMLKEAYGGRPFANVEDMNEELISRHNKIVGLSDTTVHLGDFTLRKDRRWVENALIKRLNGSHVFIMGSHDYWLDKPFIEVDTGPVRDIWQKEFDLDDSGKVYIVACHYSMRSWSRSRHGAFQIYGHSHGTLAPVGKQLDVGVDTNDFYPYSLSDLVKKIRALPDNRKQTKSFRQTYG